MRHIVYVNGDYLAAEDAAISIFDRAFLMADGVYEVIAILDGKLIDFDGHIERLARSLRELDMPMPLDREMLLALCRKLVAENNITEGLVYLQITRGAPAERDFIYPDAATTRQNIIAFTQNKPGLSAPIADKAIKIISIAEQRWHRRDIKTVQLLAASMGKMAAQKAGADDAWMIENGKVTEGTSNNTYIVKKGCVITRELSADILAGITRAAVLRLARANQIAVEERAFTIDEAKQADEAFITSASAFVTPVVEIDGVRIGDGTPGALTKRLRDIYLRESRKAAI